MCVRCGTTFDREQELFRFLTPGRAAAAAAFVAQYRAVREREGYRVADPEYYRRLPEVAAGDLHAADWRVRRESFRHLRRAVLTSSRAMRVLDLGAGCGWLSHQIAAGGHQPVAVDRLDDEVDGLGACRHYAVPFAAVQADFDALPFEPGQFDVAVFNGSLHYSADPAATLAEARRMLAPGGCVAIMDSPMFARDEDGQAMVERQLHGIAVRHGLDAPVRPGTGFLTFALLDRAAGRFGWSSRFVPSRGSLTWQLRREIGRIRLGRAPAAFGLWVAR
jgi:SAM-dependent methyltransferase